MTQTRVGKRVNGTLHANAGDVVAALKLRWVARDECIDRLVSLLQPRCGAPHVWCTGPPHTGKRSLIKDILKARAVPGCVAIVDARIVQKTKGDERVLCERVLTQLALPRVVRQRLDQKKSGKMSATQKERAGALYPASTVTRVPRFEMGLVGASYADLSRLLAQRCAADLPYRRDEPTRFVVVHNAALLMARAPRLLRVLLRVRELHQVPLCVVMVDTHLVRGSLRDWVFSLPVTQLRFPHYTVQQVVEVLLARVALHPARAGINDNILHKTVQHVCNRMQSLTSSTETCWRALLRVLPGVSIAQRQEQPKFASEKERKLHEQTWLATEVMRLLNKTALSIPRNAFDVFAARIDSFEEGREHLVELECPTQVRADMSKIDLPFNAKFLILAAYCASHNSVTFNKRVFDPAAKRGRLRPNHLQPQTCSPRAFPRTHLDSIFNILYDREGTDSGDTQVDSLLASLVALDLLSFASKGSQHTPDTAVFRCNVSRSEVEAIAASLREGDSSWFTQNYLQHAAP